MAIYGDLKQDTGWILRTLCDEKRVEIIEAEARPAPIPMHAMSTVFIVLIFPGAAGKAAPAVAMARFMRRAV